MGWATVYIDKLRKAETVQSARKFDEGQDRFGPTLYSRAGKAEEVEVGDIVLCKVNGNQYLHLVKAQGQRFQFGNNPGRINGRVGPNGIYGKCIRIE